jgi:hypothetical protein
LNHDDKRLYSLNVTVPSSSIECHPLSANIPHLRDTHAVTVYYDGKHEQSLNTFYDATILAPPCRVRSSRVNALWVICCNDAGPWRMVVRRDDTTIHAATRPSRSPDTDGHLDLPVSPVLLPLALLPLVLLVVVVFTIVTPDHVPGRILTLPLVLVLPGYAVTAALFPNRSLGVPERLVFSLGLSVAIVVLGGLLLNVTPFGVRAEAPRDRPPAQRRTGHARSTLRVEPRVRPHRRVTRAW